MRGHIIAVAVVAATVGACATGPISLNAISPQTGDAAYACGLRKVNELGYTVTNTNKEARFITGEKQVSGLGTQLLSGKKYHDQLTVSVFDADGATRRMRVTAASIEERSNRITSSKTGKAPSSKAKADANTVLSSCASGAITTEGRHHEAAVETSSTR